MTSRGSIRYAPGKRDLAVRIGRRTLPSGKDWVAVSLIPGTLPGMAVGPRATRCWGRAPKLPAFRHHHEFAERDGAAA
jgi:hypothetical protein